MSGWRPEIGPIYGLRGGPGKGLTSRTRWDGQISLACIRDYTKERQRVGCAGVLGICGVCSKKKKKNMEQRMRVHLFNKGKRTPR